MNGYKAFYKGKTTEVDADTSYQAQQAGAVFFKVKAGKSYMVTVVLCERDGDQVTHSTAGV